KSLALLLVLNEWKSDTYINTDLTYNVTLSIIDSRGTVIAKVDMKGVDNSGGDFLNPPAHSRTAILPAFKKKLEDLLNHPDVVAAFRTVNRIWGEPVIPGQQDAEKKWGLVSNSTFCSCVYP